MEITTSYVMYVDTGSDSGEQPPVVLPFTSVDEVKRNIMELNKKFNDLKNNIRECLEKSRVRVRRVVDALTSLSPDEDKHHKMFLESRVKVLVKAADHFELFVTMNFHWNYLDPGLLGHLVRELDLKGVKSQTQSYKGDLQRFRINTPLTLFCQAQRIHIDPQPGFRMVVAKFEWPEKCDDLTLEVVEEFRQKYASHYNLYEFAMMLAEVRPGSFIVTWFIPDSIVEILKAKVPRVILNRYRVTKLEIDGVCVYPGQKRRITDKMETKQRSNSIWLSTFDPPPPHRMKRQTIMATDTSRLPSYAIVTGPSSVRVQHRRMSHFTKRADHSPHHLPPLPREKSPNSNKLPGISSPSRPVKLEKPSRPKHSGAFLPLIPIERNGRPASSFPNAAIVFNTTPLSPTLKDSNRRQKDMKHLLSTVSSQPGQGKELSFHSPLLIRRASLHEQPNIRPRRCNKGTDSPSNSPHLSLRTYGAELSMARKHKNLYPLILHPAPTLKDSPNVPQSLVINWSESSKPDKSEVVSLPLSSNTSCTSSLHDCTSSIPEFS